MMKDNNLEERTAGLASPRTIGRRLATAALFLGAAVLPAVIAGTYHEKIDEFLFGKDNLVTVENPVLVENGSTYRLSVCNEGNLKSARMEIPKDRLGVAYDVLPQENRRYEQRDTPHGKEFIAHLRPGEWLSDIMYVSMGQAGAMQYESGKGYPCPESQWKTQEVRWIDNE